MGVTARQKSLLLGALCLVVSTASLCGALFSEYAQNTAGDQSSSIPHFIAISPEIVSANSDGRSSFSVRVVPVNMRREAIIEIFPSCSCLATGARSRLCPKDGEVAFDLVGELGKEMVREWNIHITARTHTDDNKTVSREIAVRPAFLNVKCQKGDIQ